MEILATIEIQGITKRSELFWRKGYICSRGNNGYIENTNHACAQQDACEVISRMWAWSGRGLRMTKYFDEEVTGGTGVHRAHCCVLHGCKYGDEDACPVVNGTIKQRYPCEDCDSADAVHLETLPALEVLKQLVTECTPPKLPDDVYDHGVKAPTKKTLEKARKILEDL